MLVFLDLQIYEQVELRAATLDVFILDQAQPAVVVVAHWL